MEWLRKLLGTSKTPGSGTPAVRHVTVNEPLIITAPRIGFLNLLGSSAQTILEEDKASFGSLFPHSEESQSEPPMCDVLIIYARVEADGSIAGSSDSLRGLMRRRAR